ncbi:Dual specificity catalytic domain-containing protein [Mycena kentingensis (nom. inval.)]|nr:Dual specificity catalytic domain-containing protein [Mycena kentingensis (nom. inval.)]
MPPMKRGPPAALRIDSAKLSHIALDPTTLSSTSGLSSAASESDIPPFNRPTKPRSLQNMKKLSLNLPSAQSSATSLSLPPASATSIHPEPPRLERQRRPSVISLPPQTGNPIATTRKVEDGSPSVPYLDGPIQIIPGIWLGSEENAKDWAGLRERGIRSILNVAKEVVSPFDNLAGHARRGFSSTPNLNATTPDRDGTFYPANLATGRPAMHYLKLQWSHGQQNLVKEGFPEVMAFADAALERGDGVLIHCQLGISRSATAVLSLVMRAAAERSPSVPSEIWALKGMQGAYTFLKEKSKWVGPNMSLIYQLLDYEKKLRGDGGDLSGTESGAEDEEWGRRRMLLDEATTDDDEDDDRENSLIMREAQYLDKAMEARFLARKTSSGSSVASSTSGVGMGVAWRNRYSRKRAGSIASNMTNGSSILSEDLVEEDEEQELLGIGGGFDDDRGSSAEPDSQSSPEDDVHAAITPRRPGGLPSAPVWKTSFNIPPPATAFRPTFNLPSAPKTKRRPAPLGALSPIPPSPVTIIVESENSETPIKPSSSLRKPLKSLPPLRSRTESKKPAPPPLHLRTALKPKNPNPPSASGLATPSQTLFLFPPSPTTMSSRTPSAMTLSSMNGPVPFPSLTTPRVSTFRMEGRTRSFIGLGAPPTPTTGFSKVDARGYFGRE